MQPTNNSGRRTRIRVQAALACTLIFSSFAAGWLSASEPSSKNKSNERPKLPYNMMGLGHDEVDAYDSKAEPVAGATAALAMLESKGWQLIQRYFPTLGTNSQKTEQALHPEDVLDKRFYGNVLSEDATLNPMPLLCAIWSLPDAQLSGKLKALRDELQSAMVLEDYSKWSAVALQNAINELTDPAKTAKGVRYRTPKSKLTFKQALELYAMTIALLRVDTKWVVKTDSTPPDMADFASRLAQQLPRQIADGATVAFFLYRPAVLNQPISKEEFEERADVVKVKRTGMTFEAEQFPVYLTADEKQWNPSWIVPQDEVIDSTLIARKYEHDWTRLDGPYLWFRFDQLNAAILYRAIARFSSDGIVLEAQREIQSRGSVKRTDRPRDYDPLLMTAFDPSLDTVAQPNDPLTVDPLSLDEQARSLKSMRYFSSAFRAWCAYGLSKSGPTPDGHGWITVLPDPPRNGRQTAPISGDQPRSNSSSALHP